MKKIIFIIMVSVLLLSCSGEKKAWEEAENQNTIEAFQKYLLDFPEGKNIELANKKIDSINVEIETDKADWEIANKQKRIEIFEEYLLKHPNGQFVKSADSIISQIKTTEINDEDAWKKAVSENTFFSYKDYLDNNYPNHKQEAEKQSIRKFRELINKEFPEINNYFATAEFIEKNKNEDFTDSIFYYFSKVNCNFQDIDIKGGINRNSLKTSENFNYLYAISEIKYFIKSYKSNDFYEFEIQDYETNPTIYFTFYLQEGDTEYTLKIKFAKEEGKMKIMHYNTYIYTPGC